MPAHIDPATGTYTYTPDTIRGMPPRNSAMEARWAAQQAIQHAAEQANARAAQRAAQQASQESARQASERANQQAGQQAARQAAQGAVQHAAQRADQQASLQAAQRAQQVAQQAGQRAAQAEQAAQQAAQRAGQQAGQQAAQQAAQQARQAANQATEQARQATERAQQDAQRAQQDAQRAQNSVQGAQQDAQRATHQAAAQAAQQAQGQQRRDHAQSNEPANQSGLSVAATGTETERRSGRQPNESTLSAAAQTARTLAGRPNASTLLAAWLLPYPPVDPRLSLIAIDDAALISKFGASELATERGLDHPKLDTFDSKLLGSSGERLRLAIEGIAYEFGIDPGLLAVNALHEDTSGNSFVTRGPVLNTIIGVDYWHSMQRGIKAAVPAATKIQSTKLSASRASALNVSVDYINEKGENAGPRYEFRDGSHALRAVAATLVSLEIGLRTAVGADAWTRIPVGERFALLRFAYNAGGNSTRALAATAAGGRSILVSSGPLFYKDQKGRVVHHPLRHATQAAGQAIHISEKVFGKIYSDNVPLTL